MTPWLSWHWGYENLGDYALRQHVMPIAVIEGRVEEAVMFWGSLFHRSRLVGWERYGPEGPGREGTVSRAVIGVGGQEILCLDAPLHADVPSPAGNTVYAACESAQDVDRLAGALGTEGGIVIAAPESPASGSKFACVRDRFGVVWQLEHKPRFLEYLRGSSTDRGADFVLFELNTTDESATTTHVSVVEAGHLPVVEGNVLRLAGGFDDVGLEVRWQGNTLVVSMPAGTTPLYAITRRNGYTVRFEDLRPAE